MTSLAALLIILDLEALAAVLWAFFTPSESDQGVFFWISPGRLVLVAVLFILWLVLLVALLRVWRSSQHTGRTPTRLDELLIDRRLLAPILIALAVLPLLVAAAALVILLTPPDYAAYKVLAPDTFPLLRSLVGALLPLLAFLVIAGLELAAYMAFHYRRPLFTAALWSWDVIRPGLLVLFVLIATVFHWLTLIFQLRFFVNLPAWYWVIDPVPFGPGDILFGLVALVLLVLAYWMLMHRRRTAAGLALVALLGLFLQLGVGLMGGRGLATLRDRYFTTYHQAYIQKASQNDLTILDSLRRYEELYGPGPFTGTKPPGLMAFYIGLEQLVNGFPSRYDEAARYERLSAVVMWLFPVIAVSIVALLYAFTRRFIEDSSGLVPRLAPLLYVLTPSLALFTFFADQAVYPLVFLLGVWLAVLAVRRQSPFWLLLLGALLFVAAFFAFTMLPLYVFAGLYLILHHWRAGHGPPLRRVLLSALALAAGTLLLHLLSLVLLNYDFIPRFQHSMAVNHNFDFYLRIGQQPPGAPEPLSVRLAQIIGAAWLNNLDFAAAVGFPIYILFFAQAVRLASRFFRGIPAPGDIILFSLLASFLVLNLAGTAQGEAPRLWLFWLPMFVTLAALELQPHLHRRPQLLLALGLAQLITLILTFHYQDLRM